LAEYNINIWENPKKDHTYIVGSDPGEGLGSDFSTAIILDITNSNHIHTVASFGSNTIAPTMFAYLVTKIATKYNKAFIIMERNGVGSGVLNTIWELYEYENVLFWKSKDEPSKLPGVYSTNKLKNAACLWAKEVLSYDANDSMISIDFKDPHILMEMEWFDRKAGGRVSFSAKQGKTDDYMMSFIWALWCIHPDVIEFTCDVESWKKSKTGISIYNKVKAFEIDTRETDDVYNDSYIDDKFQTITNTKAPDIFKAETEIRYNDDEFTLDDVLLSVFDDNEDDGWETI
jgi:hypothetical protein